MDIRVKLEIVNDEQEQFFGAGPFWLLQRIQEYGSISDAARAMDLSYVKALKLLNRVEENLGQKVVIRERGGNQRGGARLTPYGRELIGTYSEYEKQVKAFARKEFGKLKKGLAAANANRSPLVVTAYSTYGVMKIRDLLKGAGYETALIPTPRVLSAECGQAVEVVSGEGPAVADLLKRKKAEYDAVYTRAGKRYKKT